MAELIVVGFEGQHRAAEVLNELQSLGATGAIDLEDAVAVYRTDDGRLRIDRTVHPSEKEGAAWGAILSGLVGALLMAPLTMGGSVAAAASAAGIGATTMGVTGAAIGADAALWTSAAGISEDTVRQIGGMVQPGQSAVFVLARASDPKGVGERFRGYGGKVLHTTLPRDSAEKFQQLLNPVTVP